MSRLGKKPIIISQGVEIKLDGEKLHVKGPKGELKRTLPDGVLISQVENSIVVSPVNEKRKARELHEVDIKEFA